MAMSNNADSALAVSTSTRLSGWDEVPAIAETVPGFEFVGWFGIVAPTGAPADAVQRFSKEITTILRDPELVQRLAQFGAYTNESAQSPEGFAELMRSERIHWAKLLTDIGVEAE